MPDNTPRPISNAILGERIEQQGKSLTEISCGLKTLNANFTDFMRLYGVEHEKVASSTTAAHRRIDKVEERIDSMEKSMDNINSSLQALTTRMGWVMWLGAALGVLILGLLFKIFTGEVQVVFP